jgi:hypothetical protein
VTIESIIQPLYASEVAAVLGDRDYHPGIEKGNAQGQGKSDKAAVRDLREISFLQVHRL